MVNYKIVDMLFEISSMSREFVTNCGVVNNAISLLEQPYIKKDNSVQELIINDKVEIEFRNISFSYYSNNNLFSNLSVKIKSHEKIGLVGYSGSGKSSFINLILKLNEPLAGNILINNQNINEISVESLRRNIAMIPQDPSLFHRTIMDNIRYGKITASDEEIIEAAKAAKAHNFIMNLADGYNTIVGERGIKLSGGQRQRIAIARAIVKKAPILILDEATSQLDSLTENDIQDSLHPLMNSSTTIAIAHRLSTLLHMDRILVFDEGKIVQDGTHKQLIASDGVYKSMWDTQIGGFLPEKRERSAEC